MPLRIEVKSSPIHGLGLFAVEFIPKSSPIIRESKLFQITVLRPHFYNRDNVLKAMESLSEKDLAAFNSLHSEAAMGGLDILDTFMTNAITCNSSPIHERRGLYLVASRANHSHAPNATVTLLTMGENQKIVFTAVRNILKGEEVTVAYCCVRKRTASLETGFVCNCGDCPADNTGSYIGVYGTGAQDQCLCCWCKVHPQGGATPLSREIANGAAGSTERGLRDAIDEIIYSNVMNLARTTLGGVDPANAASEDDIQDLEFENAFDSDEDNNDYQEKEIEEEENGDEDDEDEDEDEEDEEEEGDDYDEDDLGQLDVRPGLHSFLE